VRRLSGAADKSRLWLAIAAVIAVAGGRRGRRAALEGVVAIAVTSATVNLGVKPIARRGRPDRAQPALFEGRHVPMPRSASFPSGHSASAFAFAYAVGRHLPVLAVPIRLLAVAVAYSRVHTGVHYPATWSSARSPGPARRPWSRPWPTVPPAAARPSGRAR
jgi:undecaprenyl-diphosphatase